MVEANKTEETRRHWEQIYQDRPLWEVPWEEGQPSAELVALINSGVVEKGAALDICCGSGNNAIFLAQQGFTCYGIDISSTAVDYARERAARENVTCQLSPGNVLALPYEEDSFTLVFDRGCWHTISPDDRETFIGGIYRVLRMGGKYQLLCFSTKDHPSRDIPYSFAPKEIRHSFSPWFKIHRIKEIARREESSPGYFLSALMEKVQ
jgi:ubiquinone/menaquinone biosynthesis C-methylase UbiE